MKTLTHRLTFLRARLAALCLALILGFAGVASAVTYTATVFTDPAFTTVNNANGVITGGAGIGSVSLRSAVEAANSQAGPHIINLPAGTYLLSASNGGAGLTPNDLVVGSNVNLDTTIQGADPANPQNTIIRMNVAGNDVIETAFDSVTGLADLPMKLTLKNLEVTGGEAGGIFTGADNGTLRSQTIIDHCLFTGNTNTSGFAAGAITVTGGDLTVTNTIVSNNSSSLASVGQGAGINYSLVNLSGQFSQGTLLVQDSTFTSNIGGYSGGAPTGAAIFVSVVATNSLTINRCTFTGNQATGGGGGGAIGVVNTNPTIAITQNNFSGNQVTAGTGHGGAISVQGGTANINFNRFSANTAATVANGGAIQVISGTVSVNDNWWASNSGPAVNDLLGVVAANWLQLKLTALASTVAVNGSTTLTASFLSDSANNVISASNLGALIGLPVTFTPGAFGTIPQAQPETILAAGTAAATFNAGNLAGVSQANALVDNAPAASTNVNVQPTVTTNAATLPTSSTTMFINGTGFDSTAANNTVSFSGGVTGTVTAATNTQLTVGSLAGLSAGPLNASVTTNTVSSGAAVQVATVTNVSITVNTANLAQNATTLIIKGTGFSPVIGNDLVTFDKSVVGNVTAATATQLTVNITTPPLTTGVLNATVNVSGSGSAGPTQVATVIPAVPAPTVTVSTANRAINAPTIVITGTNFDTTASNNTVAFDNGAVGAVTVATATQLTVTLSTPPGSTGALNAVVTSFGVSSGAPVQVATIVAAPTVAANATFLAINSTSITIGGTNFDPVPGNNTVAFSGGATGTVTAATATQLTVTSLSGLTFGSLTAVVTTDGGDSGAPVQVATVVGVPIAAGDLVISEFRLRGPNGANDEFVEIYNKTALPIQVGAADASSGFALAASDGVTRFVIPNGTVIPAHGHFLGTNSVGYSMSSYPAGSGSTSTGDVTYAIDIPDNVGIALFNNSTGGASFALANRLDAVGSVAEANTLYKEGTGYPTLTPFSIEYSFYRHHFTNPVSTGVNDLTVSLADGEPQDTHNNAADFIFVDTNGTSAGAGQRLGAPGPKNLSSPIAAYHTAPNIGQAKVDPGVLVGASPNFVRDNTSVPANNSTFGTVEFNRTFTNNTGAPLTRLRFRIVKLTTFPAASGFADLRPISSIDAVRSTTGGNVNVTGTTLEVDNTAPSTGQPNGGGWNSSFGVPSVSTGTPLANGASVNVRFVCGVQQAGNYCLALLVEGLPSASHFWYVTGNTQNPGTSGENFSGQPAGTPVAAGDLVISEFRLRGPNGANDEFVEVYNKTTAPITVQATDGSGGFALVASDGNARFVIPNGTVIPAHGHVLGTNSVGYSMNSYPAGHGTFSTGDLTWTTDIPDNAGIALFNTSATANFTLANRLDAVGSTSEGNVLYKEGAGYPALTPFSIEYALYRFLLQPPATANITDTAIALTDGEPRDTNDNAADFAFVDTNGTSAGAGQRLGAPGPKNLSSPIAGWHTSPNLPDTLLDTGAAVTVAPNVVRDLTSVPANNSTFGTLEINRTFTNNSGVPLTQLRFRIAKLTTFPAPNGITDLRPISSVNAVRSTTGGNVTVIGTTLEVDNTAPSTGQPNGGGWNSTFAVPSITQGTPLAPGATVNVRFLFGVQQKGTYRIGFLAEALPSASEFWFVSGESDNQPPNAGSVFVARSPAGSVKIPVAQILAAAPDPDAGDVVTLVSVGNPTVPAHGTATYSGNGSTGFVFYTPNAGDTNGDTFSYTVTDNHGAQATSVVNITVNGTTNGAVSSQITRQTRAADGTVSLTFAGVPGYTVGLQFTDNLLNPWVNLGPLTMNPTGQAAYTDTAHLLPAFPNVFYRLIYPAP